MAMSVKIKELDSLFILRHAQRSDKVAITTSSIDFSSTNHDSFNNIGSVGNPAAADFTITDTYNPGLATFQSTNNKSNNGCTQAMNLGHQILNYIDQNIEESLIILKFHTSPYLRCVESIRYIIDYLSKSHRDDLKTIRCIISIDQVLSEWLSTDLDINYYPPSDNGATLLSTAIQYFNSSLPFHKNANIEIQLDLHNSYKHGNPGCFNESFIQQYSRLSNGLISIIKSETNNLSMEPNSKELVIIMTHGACVRSLVSKLLGRSLYVEIPLASLSIAKPLTMNGKNYYWQLLKTDIETKNASNDFPHVDLYSKADPFQDFQTTFNHKSSNNHLDFKSLIPASKTENFNRIRSQSLLTPRPSKRHDSDDSDNSDNSDDEGISFSAGARRRRVTTSAGTGTTDNQRRFRSSSLFGPILKNPFFSDDSLSSRNDDEFENRRRSINKEDEFVSPIQKIEKDSKNLKTLSSYQNIDANDGTFGHRAHLKSHSSTLQMPSSGSHELVPDLGESLSSNNSSSNSLREDMTIIPGTFSKLAKKAESSTSISTVQLPQSQSEDSHQLSSTPKLQNKSSLFDKSLIEKTLQEINLSTPQQDQDHKESGNWLNFKHSSTNSTNASSTNGENKFKIDLYGKKDRLRLNLYSNDADDDDYDDGANSSWFLGSNKY